MIFITERALTIIMDEGVNEELRENILNEKEAVQVTQIEKAFEAPECCRLGVKFEGAAPES